MCCITCTAHVQPVTYYTVGQRCLVAVWKQYADQIVCTSVNALALRCPEGSSCKKNKITLIKKQNGVIAESTEGLLGGQKPPVQLVFRAMDEHGQRIKAIPPLLSDEFAV